MLFSLQIYSLSFISVVRLSSIIVFFMLNDDVFVLNQPKCQHERKTVKLVSPEERREQASRLKTC